jgi:hypothetical protein
VLDLRLDRISVPAGACTQPYIGEAQGDTMEACVHRILYCSAVQSSVDGFALRTLFLELGSFTVGRDLVYSILSQNGTDKTRRQGSLLNFAVALYESICAGRSGRLDPMEEAGSGRV